MKMRNGFVSNSSSSSFVVTFKYSKSYDELVDLIRLSDEWVDEHWHDFPVQDFESRLGLSKEEPSWEEALGFKHYLKQLDDSTFQLQLSTTMFNDWADVPAWVFLRALLENQIDGADEADVKIVQTEEQNFDCEVEIVPEGIDQLGPDDEWFYQNFLRKLKGD